MRFRKARKPEIAETLAARAATLLATVATPVMTCDWCHAPMPHGPRAGCGTSTAVLYRGPFLGATLGTGGGGGVSGPAAPSWKFCSKEHLDAWHAAGEPQQ